MSGRTIGGKPTMSKFTSITSESETVIKSGSGFLHSVVFSSLDGGGVVSVQLKDGTTTIADFNCTELVNNKLLFDCQFNTNLNITSDGQNLTVTYI